MMIVRWEISHPPTNNNPLETMTVLTDTPSVTIAPCIFVSPLVQIASIGEFGQEVENKISLVEAIHLHIDVVGLQHSPYRTHPWKVV